MRLDGELVVVAARWRDSTGELAVVAARRHDTSPWRHGSGGCSGRGGARGDSGHPAGGTAAIGRPAQPAAPEAGTALTQGRGQQRWRPVRHKEVRPVAVEAGAAR
uniref:Uncharacterized protein n=1 Tax=Oryza punctata TaxID=4537 RepID=A0A0E0MG45_ORYPU